MYFDDLGWPWPKHPCFDEPTREWDHIREAFDTAGRADAFEPVQLVGYEWEAQSKGIVAAVVSAANKRSIWRVNLVSTWNPPLGSLMAMDRTRMDLIDSRGNAFPIAGPLVRCHLCHRWIVKSEQREHLRSTHGARRCPICDDFVLQKDWEQHQWNHAH